ncbi:MAG TPA: ABC transporter ATP-binding protein [Bacillales bacterium]|nr:ABC transporter ATP-binding protein [Bacillales bacterium]
MTKNFDVELHNIQKMFGSNVVVDNFNLQVEKGECISFLGPSGCGKTTTLNMIAGFLEPDQGDILIKGKRVNGVHSNKRELGMVFQTYSLFPHMTVQENVAYGLNLKKVAKDEIVRRVKEVLEVVKLPHLGERYPKQLSGGQRQRIAIARALATEPSLLLLDEPLSNLDAKLREELRDELKRLQKEIGVTTIFVTHDQEEALYLSNRIVVLDHGKVEQIGTPLDIYNSPSTEFVHTFIGKSNRMEGRIQSQEENKLTLITDSSFILTGIRRDHSFSTDEKVSIYVRPEKINIATKEFPSKGSNQVSGTVKLTSFLGAYTECEVEVAHHTISVRLQDSHQEVQYKTGEKVYLQWKPEDVFVFSAKE